MLECSLSLIVKQIVRIAGDLFNEERGLMTGECEKFFALQKMCGGKVALVLMVLDEYGCWRPAPSGTSRFLAKGPDYKLLISCDEEPGALLLNPGATVQTAWDTIRNLGLPVEQIVQHK